MCDLVLIKMLRIPFCSGEKASRLAFASAEFVMILTPFWLKFDMSIGKRASCIFEQLGQVSVDNFQVFHTDFIRNQTKTN